LNKLIFLFIQLLVGQILAAPYHSITIDGDLSEWLSDELLVADSNDSLWDVGTDKNYIDGIYFTYDRDNLYLAIAGKTTERGWLLYLDVDGLSSGATDLTRINTWNRQVKFSGWAPDYFYASWDGASGNFYRLQNEAGNVKVSDLTGYVSVATSKVSAIPGSEIRIPFSLIYPGLSSKVRVGARIYLVASLATGDVGYQSEFGAYGYLGGDISPENFVNGISTATLSVWATGYIDQNLDGSPDDQYSGQDLEIKNYQISPQAFVVWREKVNLSFSLSVPAEVEIFVYNFRGEKVRRLFAGSTTTAGLSLSWDGRNEEGEICPAGIYLISARFTAREVSRKINKAVVLLR